ncbi:hypothetical protein [Streptomyces subrutilus]|uniref:hypothetical protein n=1 Tax=Streptomyces subrutilus TaxID=36818 RepID=UPI0033E2AFCA
MSETNPSLPAPTVGEAPDGLLDLADTEGGVNLVIPAYAEFAAGDRVEVYWNGSSATDPYTVPQGAGDEPVTLVLPESMLRAAGDGRGYVHYTVTDRAGNTSKPSEKVQLTINLTDQP